VLLTITTTHQPATDLGFLLHKHPARCQSFELAFGQAHVFYPQVDEQRCTAALLLEVDPLRLARHGQAEAGNRPLQPYVNDRPYVASSFLSVALAQVFGSALAGQCKQRPELVEAIMPLTAQLTVLPARDGPELLRRLFEPLGYTLQIMTHPLDVRDPTAGDSPYVTLELQAETRLRDLLTHLYVLVPVLDGQKHYYVGEAEIDKLLRRGEDWLAAHPERELITRRYLRHRRELSSAALARLADEDSADPEDSSVVRPATEEANLEQPLRLHEQRLAAVVTVLKDAGAQRVLDLGCGEGQLLQHLLAEAQFSRIVGMDVAPRALERAAARLELERLAPAQRERVQLLQGSLVYRDKRLAGYDAAALVEVIEHFELNRLPVLERVVFGEARPGLVVVTTPNAEYNALFENLPAAQMRHRDHRFEWSRTEFAAWAAGVAERQGYSVTQQPIGPEDPEHGAPTQMAVFQRSE
jgi:3' terminal RNA ribose 2'-O-methyltransferase Hen1